MRSWLGSQWSELRTHLRSQTSPKMGAVLTVTLLTVMAIVLLTSWSGPSLSSSNRMSISSSSTASTQAIRPTVPSPTTPSPSPSGSTASVSASSIVSQYVERASRSDVSTAPTSSTFTETTSPAGNASASTSPAPSPTAPAQDSSPQSGWSVSEASWYGPGFYGNTTACGQRYDDKIIGVAHKTLRCGTMVEFEHQGRVVAAPVIDRGPYTRGREWDLSAGLCRALAHCFTGPIAWRLV